jgi:hypothetical protein
MRWLIVSSFCILIAGQAAEVLAAADSGYVVVSLVPEDDPYFEAAAELRKLRGGRIILADAADVDGVLGELRQAQPRYVAVVLRPETLDENFVRKFLVLATKVDDDPFVDFAYGFVTGDSADVAVALAGAGKRAEQRRRKPELAMVGVAGSQLAESTSQTQVLPLRKGSLQQTMHMIAAGEAANANTDSEIDPAEDDTFIRNVMPTLADKSIVLFAGHGYPRRVVGGPTYKHLADQRFDGAVVMNIACYTGVTGAWFDSDWRTMRVRKKVVPAEESFCLNMLKTGVAGYVAYVSARPAGAAMFGDAVTLATEGKSIGELLRENANSVVLAHLQSGYDGLHVAELADGAAIARDRTVKNTLIEMSTGGVLFGDPKFVPFKKSPGAHPLRLKVERKGKSIVAQVEVAGPLNHFFCGDQIVMWDERQPSLRLETIVPLGDRHVSDVRLVSISLGDMPHRLTAAAEEHAGKRFLHVKATFKQPTEMEQLMRLAAEGVTGTFEITTSDVPQDAAIVRREETN